MPGGNTIRKVVAGAIQPIRTGSPVGGQALKSMVTDPPRGRLVMAAYLSNGSGGVCGYSGYRQIVRTTQRN